MLWIICSLCVTIFFSLAAYVQLNDPDGPLWVIIYGLPAVLTLLQVSSPKLKSNFIWQYVTRLHTTVCCVGALYLFYGLFITKYNSDMQWYETEDARELGGLIVLVLWLLLCQFHNRCISNRWLPVVCLPIVVIPVCLWLYTYYDEGYREKLPDHCKHSI